jgi:hypothetical protein
LPKAPSLAERRRGGACEFFFKFEFDAVFNN